MQGFDVFFVVSVSLSKGFKNSKDGLRRYDVYVTLP